MTQTLSFSSCAFLPAASPEWDTDSSPDWLEQALSRFSPVAREAQGLSVVSWDLESLNIWTCSVLSDWMFRVSSLPSLRENSISPEGAQALAQALCMNNTLKHLEYVIIGSGGMEVKGRVCFLTCSDTRVGGHHYDGLEPWDLHNSQGWTRAWEGAARRPGIYWQPRHQNSPALPLEMGKHVGEDSKELAWGHAHRQ